MPPPNHLRRAASGAQLTLLLFACACAGAPAVEAPAPAPAPAPALEVVSSAEPEPVVDDDPDPVVNDEPPARTRQEVLRRGVERFRKCYLRVLSTEPQARGNATLNLTLADNGRVTAATATSDRGVEQVVPCLLRVSRDLAFPPLDPLDDRQLSVPLVMMPGR